VSAKRFAASTLALLIGFALGTALLTGFNLRPDPQGDPLGELDFFGYCRTAYAPTTRAVLYDNDAFGWRCQVFDPLFATLEIDVSAACSLLYDTPALAATGDPGSPYRWGCYRR